MLWEEVCWEVLGVGAGGTVCVSASQRGCACWLRRGGHTKSEMRDSRRPCWCPSYPASQPSATQYSLRLHPPLRHYNIAFS